MIIPQSQYLECPLIILTTTRHLYGNESTRLSICACGICSISLVVPVATAGPSFSKHLKSIFVVIC